MPPRSNYRKKAAPARKRIAPKKTIAKTGKAFDRRVKKVAYSLMETKKKTFQLGGATDTVPLNIRASGLQDSGYGVHIANIFSQNNMTIESGTMQNQRVGRKIEHCYLRLRCLVLATFYNISTNNSQYPFDVYMIVYKDKQNPNTSAPDQIKMSYDGQGTDISGSAQNFMLPLNKTRYTIYKHTKIATFKPMPFENVPVLGSDANLQNPTIGSTNNKAFKFYTCTLPCPKTIDFRAANTSGDASTHIANAHCAIGFYVINGNGTALGSTQIRAQVYPTATLFFKDA